jgi:hypothetical protein
MMRAAVVTLMLLATMPCALAIVDLLSPAADMATNATTLSFEYYASVPGFAGCTLFVGSQQFPDPDAQSNAMNSVLIQNVAPGAYAWNVTCSGNETQQSQTRRITIDAQPPTLVVVSPQNASALQSIPVDFIANDDLAQSLSCAVSWNGAQLEHANVAANTHYASTLTAGPGNGTLAITCADAAGNAVREERTLSLQPQLFLSLSTNQQEFGIGEPVLLTVSTLPGSNVHVDVCPNQQGFVQCASALIDTDMFPQTITLPHMNKTGEYIVDALAQAAGQTRTNQTTYKVTNTIRISVSGAGDVDTNDTVTASAQVSGGVAPYQLSWLLPNGTVRTNVSTTQIHFPQAGAFNVTVTAADAAGNMRSVIAPFTVRAIHEVTFLVTDNATGAPIAGAELDFAGAKATTIADGRAIFDSPEGRHELFASENGYEYRIEEYAINASQTIALPMARSSGGPQVTITSPVQDGTVPMPLRIAYTVSHTEPVTCTLLQATDTSWFLANGTAQVSDASPKEFVRDWPAGTHTVRIECADSRGRSGSSALVTFALSDQAPDAADAQQPSAAPSDDELFLQAQLEELGARLDGISAAGQREREAIAITGFDRDLRNVKRAVQQAIRDIDSLRFRADIDDAGRTAERARIAGQARDQIARTPVGLRVLDARTYSRYVEDEHLDDVFEQLEGAQDVPEDSARVRKALLEDQQKFTISSTLLHVEYEYQGGETRTATVVSRSFTYAKDLGEGYAIIEIIPKSVAQDAGSIVLHAKADVLKKDPVLRFMPEQRIAYTIPRNVDFTRIEEIRTLLARPYEDGGGSGISGFAIFPFEGMGAWRIPALLLLAALALAWLAWHFGLFTQLRYAAYRLGRNEKVHYLRVLVNEAQDEVVASRYEKAEMLYKEIRMTYDALPAMAQNDLYEDVVCLVRAMDAYYFNIVMIELDGHLRAGDMESAIGAYEKLVGTFERLDEERQEQLVQTVTAIAHRLGAGA